MLPLHCKQKTNGLGRFQGTEKIKRHENLHFSKRAA